MNTNTLNDLLSGLIRSNTTNTLRLIKEQTDDAGFKELVAWHLKMTGSNPFPSPSLISIP